MFFIEVFFMKRRLQGHRRKSDSSWPVTSHACMSSYPCPLSPKEHFQHALQKGATMENLGIGDFIFTDRKLIFFFLQGWQESEPTWNGNLVTMPHGLSEKAIWPSPQSILNSLAAYFCHRFCSCPQSQGLPLQMDSALYCLFINTFANPGENTIQRWNL